MVREIFQPLSRLRVHCRIEGDVRWGERSLTRPHRRRGSRDRRRPHKGQDYAGQHSAIIDQETWGQTQALLAAQALPRHNPLRATGALLTGKLIDDRGNRMSPSEATKGSKRWRYYISQAILQGRRQDAGSLPRLSAPLLEAAVVDAIRAEPPNRKHPEEAIWAGLEKVVVGKANLTIRWRDAQASQAPAVDLSVPWSPTPTRRQREACKALARPPPTSARCGWRRGAPFRRPTAKPDYGWIFSPTSQGSQSTTCRSRAADGTIDPANAVAGFSRSRSRRCGLGGIAARLRPQAHDGLAADVERAMDHTRPSGLIAPLTA